MRSRSTWVAGTTVALVLGAGGCGAAADRLWELRTIERIRGGRIASVGLDYDGATDPELAAASEVTRTLFVIVLVERGLEGRELIALEPGRRALLACAAAVDAGEDGAEARCEEAIARASGDDALDALVLETAQLALARARTTSDPRAARALLERLAETPGTPRARRALAAYWVARGDDARAMALVDGWREAEPEVEVYSRWARELVGRHDGSAAPACGSTQDWPCGPERYCDFEEEGGQLARWGVCRPGR
ncbi:MAG: hypothetical protein IT385_10660 [Deltaproteobacteria bacterium]|nr:hypothetical protein [Deltaproteobacteria bacterium]